MQKDTITTTTTTIITTNNNAILMAMVRCLLDMTLEAWEEEKRGIAAQCEEEGYPGNGYIYNLRCESMWRDYYSIEIEDYARVVDGLDVMTREEVVFALGRMFPDF